MKAELKEKEDFYFNEQGYMVFTAAYLLKKGECCGNGCRHCPYNYINVAEPFRSKLSTIHKLNNT
ncbi:MAG: DUF5522 domain-containing protein [Ginsengibacter sp.]